MVSEQPNRVAVDTVHQADLTAPRPSQNLTPFAFGASVTPSGGTLVADGVSLLRDGRRITPVMGEFHYSRYPRGEWRDELLKMKSGGVDVVASYVFWIHHEEVEGEWNFTGDRDLGAFVALCGELNLPCVVRCGPWDHGEVRNGGLPEWLLDKGVALRTDDAAYLAYVSRLYAAIAGQLEGLLWKDGGPVIGVQIENEYSGDAQHLLTLKQIATDAGLDVPLYTRTGWPELRSAMPFGHFLPLFGGYAEGFWDRELRAMPGHYWKEFFFKPVRTDAAIASEHFGIREVADAPDTARYPYLTCEIGPGMPCSYHRRITVFPMDVVSVVIVKLGSGSNSPGYYMYHGGTNPSGREPWLQENQRSRLTNYNDLPVKTYDFQTALGEFGQVREQYHLLRPMHLFLRDFGERLAPMSASFPSEAMAKDDTLTFRWSIRSDGRSGFVFVNNYHRLTPLPARPDVAIKLTLDGGDVSFPPTTIAADRAFIWPFNFDLGDGITLRHATAQLVCQLSDGATVYTVFAEAGNAAAFEFDNSGEAVAINRATPGNSPIATLVAKNGVTHQVLLLDADAAKTVYKGRVAGAERIVLASADCVMFDGGDLRVCSTASAATSIAMLPAPAALTVDGASLNGVADGAFTRYTLPVPTAAPGTAKVERVRDAGPPRTVQLGAAKVAEQPSEAEYDAAAVWRITLPANVDRSRKLLLRFHYTGDVARASIGGTLLTDNFYNGTPFDVGRLGTEAWTEGVTLRVLPLQKGAPIFMLDAVRPNFGDLSAVASLDRVEVIESHEWRLSVR